MPGAARQATASNRAGESLNGYRGLLLDMHVPSWDPEFLAHLRPDDLIERLLAVDADEVTFYAQSHMGLCYWPSITGQTHPALAGRDLVGDVVTAFQSAGRRIRLYYSTVLNNWAYEHHRAWRMEVRPRSDGGFPGPRYGLCCPNAPGYVAFCHAQVTELLSRYDVHAFFFDMSLFFPPCICPNCRTRLASEAGIALPETIDWSSDAWVSYQDSRERWAGGESSLIS